MLFNKSTTFKPFRTNNQFLTRFSIILKRLAACIVVLNSVQYVLRVVHRLIVI